MDLTEGMFWMNRVKDMPVETAVLEAADHFRKTRGYAPTVVEVHPKDNTTNTEYVMFDSHKIVVLNGHTDLRNHLLMGVLEKDEG